MAPRLALAMCRACRSAVGRTSRSGVLRLLDECPDELLALARELIIRDASYRIRSRPHDRAMPRHVRSQHRHLGPHIGRDQIGDRRNEVGERDQDVLRKVLQRVRDGALEHRRCGNVVDIEDVTMGVDDDRELEAAARRAPAARARRAQGAECRPAAGDGRGHAQPASAGEPECASGAEPRAAVGVGERREGDAGVRGRHGTGRHVTHRNACSRGR